MNQVPDLRREVLDLGLEDQIPLWDVARPGGAAGVQFVSDEIFRRERISAVMIVLIDLLRSREIRVFVGPWHEDDPREVEGSEAEALLRDPRRYTVEDERAEDLDRVYYVNVENMPH